MPSARHERPHGGVSERQEKNDENDIGLRAERMQRERIIGAVSCGLDQSDPDDAGIGRAKERGRLPRKHQPGALVPPIRMPALRRSPLPAPSGAGIAANPWLLTWGEMRRKPFLSMAAYLRRNLTCSDCHPYVRPEKGHPSVPTLRSTKAPRRRARSKARAGRGTGRFFALYPGKKYRTCLLIRDGAPMLPWRD
jgi:hypothetical protein